MSSCRNALAGTDLILPAVPSLPKILNGDIAIAQLVIAAFVAGTATGLLVFGAAGPRFGRRQTFIGALAAYAALSYAATLCENMGALITLRFLQGIVASAPAVFAPAFIRTLFEDPGSTKAFGLLGSLESLVPAFAPLLGAWLLQFGGWKVPFLVTAASSAMLALAMVPAARVLPRGSSAKTSGSYISLLKSKCFWRYAASQAFVLGGLLIFVFGAPVVIVTTMGGVIGDFVAMQIVGVSCFIVAANVTGFLVQRFGAESLIFGGSLLACVAALIILGYAALGGRNPTALVFMFAPMNFGLGLRGPPGFLHAIIAGGGNDERVGSLTLLAMMMVASGGTSLLAPVIHFGLITLAVCVAFTQVLAVLTLVWLPPLSLAERKIP